ncbi:unnamed protein product, partial [Alternaria alternata]
MAFIILFMGDSIYCYRVRLHDSVTTQAKRLCREAAYRKLNSNETVHNWQIVAYFNRLVFEHKRYAENILATISAQYSYYFRSMGGHAAQDLLTTFGFAGACVFGMSQIVTGRKPVGNLVHTDHVLAYDDIATLYAFDTFTFSVHSSMPNAYFSYSIGKLSVADQDGVRDIVVSAGEVEFKDVDFHYDERYIHIIKGVNLKAEGGQTIAFVGETGGGKSTMLKLLFRFYDVTGGSIMIDGQDLRSVTQASLRDAIGGALFSQRQK